MVRWEAQVTHLNAQLLTRLEHNPACDGHIITPHLHAIKLSCLGLGVQPLWPLSLGPENTPGSCFVPYTCCCAFPAGLDTQLTALAEKLITEVGGGGDKETYEFDLLSLLL